MIKKSLLVIIGILILFPGIIVPMNQIISNHSESECENCTHDHDDDLQSSYPICMCGHPTCSGNAYTCPCCGIPPPPPPPVSPTLYDIPSPNDNGIITLVWTSVSGAISYKVYRSDAEFGTYTLIATTSSLSYTDTVTSGIYWYYVRAHNNDGDSGPSNRRDVEVYLYQDTWYESNEEYNVGDFPANEWDPYGGSVDRMDVAWASNYNVDMYGKVIRMESPGYGIPTGAERFETFTINTGESLYLKFKAQMNKEYANGEGRILLVGGSGQTFLEISFNSQYERIDFWAADGQLMQYWDQVLNRVIDFDIMFVKDPGTNYLKYLIFIDQKLEFLHEVNTALYPIATYVDLLMNEAGTGEFFIDNFFLGHVDNYITPKEIVDTAFPVYFLYAPEYTPGMDHVGTMTTKFRYEKIQEQSMTFSLSLGLSFADVIGIDTSVPITTVMETTPGETYLVFQVGTSALNPEDVIVFYRITADISDITFYLPGIEPETGLSEITGMYDYDFIEEELTGSSTTDFEQEFGSLPPEYDEYSRSGNAEICDYRTIRAGVSGNIEGEYELNRKVLDLSWEYEWGISISIPLWKYVGFDFGISFQTSCTLIYENEISLEIDWVGVGSDDKIQIDLYAPPEGSYRTSLDLPPYSVNQIAFHEPTNPTGLSAIPGQNRVDLSWNANLESDIDHYNIYRNNAKVGESTTTSYANTGLADSTTYTYKVSAVNIYGEEGPYSNSVPATTNPPPVTPATPGIYLIMIVSFGIVGLLINRKSKRSKIDR